MNIEEWQAGNAKEHAWWGDCTNTADEEKKQEIYVEHMGLNEYRQGNLGWLSEPLWLEGKSVLDIGGGPVSLLLKCKNLGRAVVLDPGHWPDWVMGRYEAAGIGYVRELAEDADLGVVFDEVWLYNVLQHVRDPAQVIGTALKHGHTVRVWEWLGGEANESHPHILSKVFLDGCLGTSGRKRKMDWERYLPTAYSACVQMKHVSRVEQPDSDITVTVTSCGRVDLLERTLASLMATVGRSVKVIILDDGEDADQHVKIIERFADIYDLYIPGIAHGHAWALDVLYSMVKTPYLFHCEDDWEFLKTGYIEESLDVLNENSDIIVVGLAKDEEFTRLGAVGERHETKAETVYYEHCRWRIDKDHAYWNGWIGSPNLKRRVDCLEMGRFLESPSEVEYDRRFAKSGKRSVWLAEQYVRHTGGGRTVWEGWPRGKARDWTKPSIGKRMQQTTTNDHLRFHLLGLAHLPTHVYYSPCAYTQKVVKMAAMLKDLGHEVIFYGGEGSDVECDEFVQVLTELDRREAYGDYDWRSEFFRHDGGDRAYRTFNENAIPAIEERKQKGDFLLCPMGNYQKPIADAVGNDIYVVEPGIGYRGIFSKFRVFESYAWMHFLYGLTGQHDGSWYDAVIPNYFDPKDFPYQSEKGDYALYMGRLIRRKGLDIAVQVTRELGLPLVIAGQGTLKNESEGLDLTQDDHIDFVGTVGPERRKELMGGAKMAFVPTYYLEPFGGVAVEAMMCGTPVLTTDWGVFSETVVHGVTGFRCRTFDDFVWAAKNVDRIDTRDCRDWAIENYSMDRVKQMFQEYFMKVADIGRKGWYEPHPERQDLNWLCKTYPVNGRR